MTTSILLLIVVLNLHLVDEVRTGFRKGRYFSGGLTAPLLLLASAVFLAAMAPTAIAP